MDNLNLSKIYLASKSPRRRELLKQIDADFEVLTIDIPEAVQPDEDYLTYSRRICEEKAAAAIEYIAAHNLPEYPVLTADTDVVIDDEVLGKPVDYDDAFRIWKRLSGRRHLVVTTITLQYREFKRTVTSQSWVHFGNVSDEEIHAYLATGDHQDKSGAYGIHGYAGQFIEKIDGCFYAIMGLPLNSLRVVRQEMMVYFSGV